MHKAIEKRQKYIITQLKKLDEVRKLSKLYKPKAKESLQGMKEELEANIAPFLLLKEKIDKLEKELNQ